MGDIVNNNLEKRENLYLKEFSKGILKENPSIMLLLGLCPTLAVTTKVSNAIGMGLSATFVLICSNFLISLLKDFIPDKVRIPSYIVVIASFVTIVDMLMNAFLPVLAKSLGIFIPLIVVNCIILGRAEAFANKNKPGIAVLDGLGMGIGFTLALILIAFIRESLSTLGIDFSDYSGKFLSFFTDDPEKPYIKVNGFEIYSGAKILTLPAGALFVFGIILAIINTIKSYSNKIKNKKTTSNL
ncbi:MAG TPA: electron transport complex subunit E [Spirochaetota bacterium]|nr:electron transport complex subunit E [Spirochaetota bacterium]